MLNFVENFIKTVIRLKCVVGTFHVVLFHLAKTASIKPFIDGIFFLKKITNLLFIPTILFVCGVIFHSFSLWSHYMVICIHLTKALSE